MRAAWVVAGFVLAGTGPAPSLRKSIRRSEQRICRTVGSSCTTPTITGASTGRTGISSNGGYRRPIRWAQCVGKPGENPPRDFQNTIFDPVRNHLNANPDLKAKIMGILVGFRVPGNFYQDSTHPPQSGNGGWSVSNNLQDLAFSTWFKRTNPHAFAAYYRRRLRD